MANGFLPYGRQVIEDDDIAAVTAVLRSDYLTAGPATPAFEAAFAAEVGARHAIACSSGTAALHLISLAHGLGPGMSVIVPTITFLATASAPHLCGAEIVFADVDSETGLMTPQTLREAIARSSLPVGAVFAVHLAGQACDMGTLGTICREAGAQLFEDACHAIGSRYSAGSKEHCIGGCAHSGAAAFSLHPVKTIAAGEGGVVTTNNDVLADRMRRLRSHGMERDSARLSDRAMSFDADGTVNAWAYEMHEPGLNYRLTEFQAALAQNQLKKLPRLSAARAAIAARYDELLAPLAPSVRPMPRVADCSPVLHLYQARIDFARIGLSRAAVMERLNAKGIGTQVHFIPVHRQPYYAARYCTTLLQGADAFYLHTLSLPLFAGMKEGDVGRVYAALAESIRHD